MPGQKGQKKINAKIDNIRNEENNIISDNEIIKLSKHIIS